MMRVLLQLLEVAGLAAIVAGLALIYWPLALIVGGVGAVLFVRGVVT